MQSAPLKDIGAEEVMDRPVVIMRLQPILLADGVRCEWRCRGYRGLLNSRQEFPINVEIGHPTIRLRSGDASIFQGVVVQAGGVEGDDLDAVIAGRQAAISR